MVRRFNRFSMIEHTLFSHPFKNSNVDKKKSASHTINKCQLPDIPFFGGKMDILYFSHSIHWRFFFFFFGVRSFRFCLGNNTRVGLAET